ncbi:MAG: bifunctional aldolase/short-chain dehydrogenase [Pseudomonadales bacterium]|nr:bifunctional aldolase/short-chain dehydrogenase [Pseudomonadales bacterium]
MNNLWTDGEAARFADDTGMGLRVYSSQLLGREPDLVLHGGGNTSVKIRQENLFGEPEPLLYVKGSGWDLRTIQAAGFAPVRLSHLQALARLEALSDTQMMQQLRVALTDPAAPTPSVEAILHALIPHRYVDHTHADAVVAISNTPDGEQRLQAIYGDEVLILPYVMPGFILARQVQQETTSLDWSRYKGIILLHHGIITFADDARTSYDNMIALVSRAEDYLHSSKAALAPVSASTIKLSRTDLLQLATLRQKASAELGQAVLLRSLSDAAAVGFSQLDNAAELIGRGPLTPDHSIHTKPFGAVFTGDAEACLQDFAQSYQAYFQAWAQPRHQCLDLLPRFALWPDRGMLALAANAGALTVVSDICSHTLRTIQWGEALGGWTTLPQQDQFNLEYWELEQAKLKRNAARPEFAGKVVMISGAASGIGKACVEAFVAQGACVVALDINADIDNLFTHAAILTLVCDITDPQQIEYCLDAAIARFGGLDILVCNAGVFPPSARLGELPDALWDQSLALNLTAHRRMLSQCLPFLELGIQSSVVFVGSKNVAAPGPGAAAYSVAKAGLAQLARVAALELAEKGIRVNTVHPNAVFDTALWTEEVLQKRADNYGLTVEEYRRNTLLGCEVKSADVATAVTLLAGQSFSCTTGAQLPVDGGNERVI